MPPIPPDIEYKDRISRASELGIPENIEDFERMLSEQVNGLGTSRHQDRKLINYADRYCRRLSGILCTSRCCREAAIAGNGSCEDSSEAHSVHVRVTNADLSFYKGGIMDPRPGRRSYAASKRRTAAGPSIRAF